MPSSEALARIRGSVRAQQGTVAAIGAVGVLYVVFLGVMARGGTHVAEQFYARQEAWHVGKLEAMAREVAQVPGASLPVELAGPALPGTPFVRTFGFFPADRDVAWTQQRLSSLAIKLAAPPDTDLLVTFRLQGVLGPSRPVQEVSLDVGGTRAATWSLQRREGAEELQARVPRASVGPDGVLTLVLHVPDPRAKAALGVGWDHRMLGVGVVSLRIATAD